MRKDALSAIYLKKIFWRKKTMAEKKILKKFDADETYKRIVKFYVDKKGYSIDQANSIAESKVKDEKRRRNLA